MDMKKINIVVTMDCEPTTQTTHPTATGPHDWDLGRRATEGYADIVREYGFPVTFFIHPEAAVAQADMFRDLRAGGASLALHMHPWKYSMWRYQGKRYMAHYGGLTEQEQRDLLIESSAMWADALGEKPTLFRPGTFSANDAIFKVLAELGFKGGSCSVPGRMMPEMRAVWTGAEPDPHRTDPSFRQVRGTLDFVNVPVSTDFSTLLEGRLGRRLHPDLRPDIDWEAEYGVTYPEIARNLVRQIMERKPTVPAICFISHNHYDYCDEKDPATIRLRQSLEALRQACDEADIHAKPATIHDVVDAVMGTPLQKDEIVLEGAIMNK